VRRKSTPAAGIDAIKSQICSGNIWIGGGAGVYQLIGLSTPVVTPIAANLITPYAALASKP